MHSEDRELNQATSKPDPVNQPVRTAHTIVHSAVQVAVCAERHCTTDHWHISL